MSGIVPTVFHGAWTRRVADGVGNLDRLCCYVAFIYIFLKIEDVYLVKFACIKNHEWAFLWKVCKLHIV